MFEGHTCHLKDYDILSIVVAPFYITLSICAILGNSLVIASVMLFSNLRTPTNNFVVALALADLMVRKSLPPLMLLSMQVVLLIWIKSNNNQLIY